MKRYVISMALAFILVFGVPIEINTSTAPDGTKVVEEILSMNDLHIFLDSIAYLESRGVPTVVNKFGMMGKYQFSPITLSFLGYNVSKDEFLSDEDLQDRAMLSYLRSNYRELYPLFIQYEGKYVNGVKITLSGVLAGAHFAGAGGMKKFLTQSIETTDYFGTNLSYYMNRFAAFNIPVEELLK